jgi:hypothetical protein
VNYPKYHSFDTQLKPSCALQHLLDCLALSQ